MSIISRLKSKMYFNSIFLWVTGTIVIVVTIFSVVVYFNFDKTIMNREYQNNMKILSQIKYNIDTMNDMVKGICLSTFRSSDTVAIMYNKEDDDNLIDFIQSMDKLKNVVQTNSFVKSIYIYNNKNKKYYSSYNSIYYNDVMLDELIENFKTVPKLTPILRKIKVEGKNNQFEDVFTYFMYDGVDKNNIMDGSLIVNVNVSWVFDNFAAINGINEQNGDKIFLTDSQGNFIGKRSEDPILEESLKTEYENQENNDDKEYKSSGLFNFKSRGKQYIASYIKVQNANWVVFKTQPIDLVYSFINKVKQSIIIITIVFFIVAFIASLSISQWIYKPIGNIVKMIKEMQPREIGETQKISEIEFLNNTFKNTIIKISKYESEKRSNEELEKNYYFREILFDSSPCTPDTIHKGREVYRNLLSESNKLSVCIFKIDNYKEFCEDFSSEDRELYKFAIMNVTSEVLAKKYKNDTVDMKNDQIVIFIKIDDDIDFFDEITKLINEVQDFILYHFKISFSASVSKTIPGTEEIASAYSEALSNSLYRYVLNKKSVITPISVEINNRNTSKDSLLSISKELAEKIKAGNLEKIKEFIEIAFKEISKYNYRNISFSIMYLINEISNCIREIQQMNIKPVNCDLNILTYELLECETIDILQQRLFGFIEQFILERNSSEDKKRSILSDTVKDIIGSNYHEPGFCAQNISDILKLSSTHIGRIFKSRTGLTIPEYINEVRMNKALEFLKESKYSISEISAKVGMDNVTYFYKVFKKRFGITPKEYILKNLINI